MVKITEPFSLVLNNKRFTFTTESLTENGQVSVIVVDLHTDRIETIIESPTNEIHIPDFVIGEALQS